MLGVQYVPKTQHSLRNTNFLMKKRQELFTLREHIGSHPFWRGPCYSSLLGVLCAVFSLLFGFVLCIVLPVMSASGLSMFDFPSVFSNLCYVYCVLSVVGVWIVYT
jgi:hypothetical protein